MGSGNNEFQGTPSIFNSRNSEKPKTSPLENMNIKFRSSAFNHTRNETEESKTPENIVLSQNFHFNEKYLIENIKSFEDQKKSVSTLQEENSIVKKIGKSDSPSQFQTLHYSQNVSNYDKVGKPPVYPKSLGKSLSPILNDNINICEKNDNIDIEEYKKEDLKIAVETNNLDLASKLLRKFEYNENDLKLNNGQTLLHIASRLNYSKILQILISSLSFVSPDIRNINQSTLLNTAIRHSAKDSIDVLIEYGCNPNHVDMDGYSSIILCCIQESSEIAQKLVNASKCGKLSEEINPNLKDKRGLGAIHYAVIKNNLDLLNLLLEYPKIDVNLESNKGCTPLIFTAKSGSIEAMRLLISKKSDCNRRDSSGSTSLHYATEKNNLEIIKFLIENGADVNISDNFGKTPIFNSIYFKDCEVLELFISKGANIQATDIYGHTCLYNIVNTGDIEMTKILIEKYNAEVNAFTLAHPSIENEFKSIKVKTPVELANIQAKVPLHIASARGFFEILEFLVKKGSNLNLQGRNGVTSLHLALLCNQIKAAKFLIQKGADFNIKNSEGTSSIDLINQIFGDKKEEIFKDCPDLNRIKEAVLEDSMENSIEVSSKEISFEISPQLECIKHSFGTAITKCIF